MQRLWVVEYFGFIGLAIVMAGSALFLTVERQLPAHAVANITAVDGDTLRAGSERIRLYGIDAPELLQTCNDAIGRAWTCGRDAKARLAALVADGAVLCAPRGVDAYGRTLAVCSAGKVPDIAEVMVREGYAIDYGRYSWRYSATALSARIAGRGIWRGRFEHPEEWRRRHPQAD